MNVLSFYYCQKGDDFGGCSETSLVRSQSDGICGDKKLRDSKSKLTLYTMNEKILFLDLCTTTEAKNPRNWAGTRVRFLGDP